MVSSVTLKNISKIKYVPVKVDGNDVKCFSRIPLKNDKIDDLFMHMEHEGDEHFNIFVSSDTFGQLGRDQIAINPPFDMTLEAYIEVLDKFRSSKNPGGITQGAYIGEAMRLGSIIASIENGMRAIDLLSLPQAIFFHRKYGFEPKIGTVYKKVMEALTHMASDNHPKLKVCSDKSKEIIEKMRKQKSKKFVSQKISKDTNKIITEYLDTIVKENIPVKEHNFQMDLPMRLSVEDIKRKKEVFNSLFEKHGIDYTI